MFYLHRKYFADSVKVWPSRAYPNLTSRDGDGMASIEEVDEKYGIFSYGIAKNVDLKIRLLDSNISLIESVALNFDPDAGKYGIQTNHPDLKGLEVDILPNGQLVFDPGVNTHLKAEVHQFTYGYYVQGKIKEGQLEPLEAPDQGAGLAGEKSLIVEDRQDVKTAGHYEDLEDKVNELLKPFHGLWSESLPLAEKEAGLLQQLFINRTFSDYFPDIKGEDLEEEEFVNKLLAVITKVYDVANLYEVRADKSNEEKLLGLVADLKRGLNDDILPGMRSLGSTYVKVFPNAEDWLAIPTLNYSEGYASKTRFLRAMVGEAGFLRRFAYFGYHFRYDFNPDIDKPDMAYIYEFTPIILQRIGYLVNAMDRSLQDEKELETLSLILANNYLFAPYDLYKKGSPIEDSAELLQLYESDILNPLFDENASGLSEQDLNKVHGIIFQKVRDAMIENPALTNYLFFRGGAYSIDNAEAVYRYNQFNKENQISAWEAVSGNAVAEKFWNDFHNQGTFKPNLFWSQKYQPRHNIDPEIHRANMNILAKIWQKRAGLENPPDLFQSARLAGSALPRAWDESQIRLISNDLNNFGLDPIKFKMNVGSIKGNKADMPIHRHLESDLLIIQKTTSLTSGSTIEKLIQLRGMDEHIRSGVVPLFKTKLIPDSYFELNLMPLGYESLRGVLEGRRQLSDDQQVQISEQFWTYSTAAKELDVYLQERGIFHGHAHTGNTLVNEQGHIVLIDWSLALVMPDDLPEKWGGARLAQKQILIEDAARNAGIDVDEVKHFAWQVNKAIRIPDGAWMALENMRLRFERNPEKPDALLVHGLVDGEVVELSSRVEFKYDDKTEEPMLAKVSISDLLLMYRMAENNGKLDELLSLQQVISHPKVIYMHTSGLLSDDEALRRNQVNQIVSKLGEIKDSMTKIVFDGEFADEFILSAPRSNYFYTEAPQGFENAVEAHIAEKHHQKLGAELEELDPRIRWAAIDNDGEGVGVFTFGNTINYARGLTLIPADLKAGQQALKATYAFFKAISGLDMGEEAFAEMIIDPGKAAKYPLSPITRVNLEAAIRFYELISTMVGQAA